MLKKRVVQQSALATWGYVTCKFSTRVEIHPGLNSTLPMVKALFVVTCLNELKIQPNGYFNPVLIRQVFTIDYVKLSRNHAEFSRSKND